MGEIIVKRQKEGGAASCDILSLYAYAHMAVLDMGSETILSHCGIFIIALDGSTTALITCMHLHVSDRGVVVLKHY